MAVFQTIKTPSELSIKILGSTFIGFTQRISTSENHKTWLTELRELHPEASHHCSGYRLGIKSTTTFFSDDGEPSGTAGKPILNAITRANLYEVGIVVVRYFGGTKLGVRGLIDAYGDCADEVIRLSGVEMVETHLNFSLSLSYSSIGLAEKLLHSIAYDLRHQAHDTGMSILGKVKEDEKGKLMSTLQDALNQDLMRLEWVD
jgi:uncharacterized YigZ family protein